MLFLNDLLQLSTGQTLFITSGLPWLFLLIYAGYYYFFKRPREIAADKMIPFNHFLDCLTAGASAGYDKALMGMFHPELLENVVERGMVRAMMRCLCEKFGKVERIPRDTVALRSNDQQVNVVALVDFQRAKQVKCQVSWAWRSQECKIPTRFGSTRSFYVKGFHIEPRPADHFDVLKYIQTSDFVPFAERFVERLFERPPLRAVSMMAPQLQERYRSDASSIETGVKRVVDLCGGLGDTPGAPSEVDATLVSEKIHYARSKGEGKGEGGEKDGAEEEEEEEDTDDSVALQEMEMIFSVRGVRRGIEVIVGLTVVELRCYVVRYKVIAQPDTRTQILLDYDTGERTIVS